MHLVDEKDKLISQLTVRLRTRDCVIGTGILYYEEKLNEHIYVFTSAHCLNECSNKNGYSLCKDIKLDMYSMKEDMYKSISINDSDVEIIDREGDLAIILVKKTEVQNIIGKIPCIEVATRRADNYNFVIKGFPRATCGKELDVIYPVWKQKMTCGDRVQLELTESYSDHNIRGFSGSGVILIADECVYLYGILQRYRGDEKGKVIYCQTISSINQILSNNSLAEITISYLGNHGLSARFFKNHISKSVENLGPRYSEELNFKLPIARVFNDISFDDIFRTHFFGGIEKWLSEHIYCKFKCDRDLECIDNKLFSLKNKVRKWVEENPISVKNPIKIDWVIDDLKELDKMVHDKISKLYKLSREESIVTKERNKKAPKYNIRYDEEIYFLNKIVTVNRELIRNLSGNTKVDLANNPILIIYGEAGSGKSHLLGDIANQKIRNGLPAILLLGQHFPKARSIQENIVRLLDFGAKFNQLLDGLNNVGEQIGSRVIILIDAINEGSGTKLWKNEIRGLISEILSRPFIGLVLTIRTTYIETVLPVDIKNNKKINFLEHQGFRENEYKALRHFCEFYKLNQPSFPILVPEFSNPLFLKIICKGVKNSSNFEFPKGLQGMQRVFNLFLDAINKELEAKREEYRNRNLVATVISEISLEIFRSKYKNLRLECAHSIIDKKFPNFECLLNDLIDEGVFIKNLFHDHTNNESYDVIYFAYERFSDYCIASELLRNLNEDYLFNSFSENTDLGRLIDDYSNHGVLEALSILIPEKFGHEIYEVFDWIFSKTKELRKKRIQDDRICDRNYETFKDKSNLISRFFLDSLNWRSIKSIDVNKIYDWIKSNESNVDDDSVLLKIVELSYIKNHPLNSDFLHKILLKYDMANRDGFWQSFLRSFHGTSDEGNGFPLERLLDWAWRDNISERIDGETARLCGQTLTWVLSSPIRSLRDQTTKALVNLLVAQPDALLKILEAFEVIDDLYIRERLCAVAYGYVLRTKKVESIDKIASYIYDVIFKSGNPPKHILLRDYSRNIIEYAIHMNSTVQFDLKLVRPPYGSDIPKFPTKNEISKYYIDPEDPRFDKNHQVSNKIYFDVIKWDFGNKEIDFELNHFSNVSYISEKKYTSFYKRLKKEQKIFLNGLKKCYQLKEQLIRDNRYASNIIGDDDRSTGCIEKLNQFESKALDIIDKIFDKQDIYFVENVAIKYIRDKEKMKLNRGQLDSMPFKRWVVNRVFDLGYDVELHGNYDSSVPNSDVSIRYKQDSISEKYQWIALHEMLGIVADNYIMIDIGNTSKHYSYEYYKGTWQLGVRDIDPISIRKMVDEGVQISDETDCWSKVDYGYWDKPNFEWSESLNDLPKIEDILLKKDSKNNEWLNLRCFLNWNEPKKFGEDRGSLTGKTLNYLIQGYLMNKSEKNEIFEYLKTKNFFGRWMPEKTNNHNNIFNREKFWSPAYNDQSKEESEWVELIDNKTRSRTGHQVMVATTRAKAIISEDKSGATFEYNIPCKALFEGLKLKYSTMDGNLEDDNNEIVVTNISTNEVLIKKEKLIEYLEEKNLSIIWTLMGEKIALNGNSKSNFGVPCGTYHMENGLIKGNLVMYSRNS